MNQPRNPISRARQGNRELAADVEVADWTAVGYRINACKRAGGKRGDRNRRIGKAQTRSKDRDAKQSV